MKYILSVLVTSVALASETWDVPRECESIQAAIDACGRNGGGVVVVPAGRYVTGTIKLKSKVTLEVAEGGEILGSKDLADYATDIQGSIEAPKFSKCLIYAENAEDITISQ